MTTFEAIIEDLKEYDGDGHVTDHLLDYLRDRHVDRLLSSLSALRKQEG